MAEQDYKKRIEDAKAALAGYSETEKQLRALYDQAIKNADAAYAAERERVEAQAKKDKTAAAVETKRLEKNLDQTLASRGLAFSGENAQTALDLSLLLQNRLADIDADAEDKQTALAIENAGTKAELEEKKLSAEAAQAAKKTELAAKLAGLESVSEPAQEISAVTADGKPDPVGTMQAIAGKIYDSAQKVKESHYVTPAISAVNLAKQMVKTVSGESVISGEKQQMGITNLLAKMQEEGELEPSYLKQLLLNLQSFGYATESGKAAESDEKTLKNNAADEYFRNYNRFYRVYSLAELPADEIVKRAKEDATLAELQYLYDHTANNDQFRKIVEEMELTDRLESFYQKNLDKKNK